MTAAPTFNTSDIGTGVGDTDVSLAGVLVGDLIVIIVNDQESSAALTTTVGGSAHSPSWASDAAASNATQRNWIQSTVADAAGTWVVSVSPFSNGSTRRIIGMVFTPASGDSWGSTRVATGTPVSQSSTAGGASQDVGTYSDPAKPCVAIGTVYSPSTSNTSATPYAWDGGSSVAAQINVQSAGVNLNACSAGWSLYADTGGTRPSKLHVNVGMNNSHEATVIVYQTTNGASGGETGKSVERGVARGVTRGVAA